MRVDTFFFGEAAFLIGEETFFLGEVTFFSGETTFAFLPRVVRAFCGDGDFTGESAFLTGEAAFFAGEATFFSGEATFFAGEAAFVVAFLLPVLLTGDLSIFTFLTGDFFGDFFSVAAPLLRLTRFTGVLALGDGLEAAFFTGEATFFSGDATFFTGDTTFFAGDASFFRGEATLPLRLLTLFR